MRKLKKKRRRRKKSDTSHEQNSTAHDSTMKKKKTKAYEATSCRRPEHHEKILKCMIDESREHSKREEKVNK